MGTLNKAGGQAGSAMVTALLLTAMMLTMSLAAISLVDSQQRESGTQRKREATFNLTEGVLNTQIFLMSRDWPGTAPTAYPRTCTKANAADVRCPDDPRLVASFKGVDYNKGIAWTTEIRDNVTGSQNYYDDGVMSAANIPSWDANGDSYMWVRSQSLLPDGKARTLVALVKAEQLATNFPNHAVVAGSIDITQNGNQSYIYTTDANGVNGRVVVRCSPPSASGCAREGKDVQISPATVESDPAMKPAMTPEAIDRLREAARASGTYYAGGASACPSSLTGDLIFIENATGCEAFNSNTAVYNSKAKPGVLVVGSGHLYVHNPTFYGLIYHVNGSDGVGSPQPAGSPAMTSKGNTTIIGAVIIDGAGELEIGNNNGGSAFPGNLWFDSNARNSLKAFGTAGIVQNSFREIQAKR